MANPLHMPGLLFYIIGMLFELPYDLKALRAGWMGNQGEWQKIAVNGCRRKTESSYNRDRNLAIKA